MSEHVELDPLVAEVDDRCSISISNRAIDIYFGRPLLSGPHKPTHVERMAAGALLGIARTLTGHAEADMLCAAEKATKGRARR